MNTSYTSSAGNSSSIKVRVAFDLDMPLAPAILRMFNSLSRHPLFEVFLLTREADSAAKAERWGFWVKPEHLHVVPDEKQKWCVENKIDLVIGPHSVLLHS